MSLTVEYLPEESLPVEYLLVMFWTVRVDVCDVVKVLGSLLESPA